MANREFDRYAPPPAYTPERRNGGWDLSKGGVNVVTAAVAAAVVVSGAWWGATQLTTILLTLEQMPERFTTTMEKSIAPLDARVRVLERDAEEQRSDRYTKSDHDLFCSKAALENQRIGWKCPDEKGFQGMPPVWDGVTTTTRKQ